jgi:hypothetical protein
VFEVATLPKVKRAGPKARVSVQAPEFFFDAHLGHDFTCFFFGVAACGDVGDGGRESGHVKLRFELRAF